jgi:tetratricopeptide (TPR) repeat protein
MTSARHPAGTFAGLPDPGQAGTLDGLVERLRLLKVWAGDPSYERITGLVNAGWTAAGRPPGELAGKTTVVDCFRPGRRRLNTDLVVAVVQVLHPDPGYAAQWRQALRVVCGRADAAGQARVRDALPPDLPAFTGRTTVLDRIGEMLRHGCDDDVAVVIVALTGMAGAGKTQLAVHAAHGLAQHRSLDRVLFVDLRGFHPDPNQPPAAPDAVLDGFLRLLAVPGPQIPHGLSARVGTYRRLLAGTHTLVVLDNAADEEQVRPLLPHAPGCPTLVTSRRSLARLRGAAPVTVGVFTAAEAVTFLARAAPGVAMGSDPAAAARIAHRCGHLPLALGLAAGHIRATEGWTLSDHADRLDDRHRQRRLDTGLELALDLSYQHLDTGQRRLLRRAALHPGQDFDVHAAAALSGTDVSTTSAGLRRLHREHLLQQSTPGRYTFHNLVRAYAADRAADEDPPAERRAAQIRLLDHYVGTSAAAMRKLHAGAADQPLRTPAPSMPGPPIADPTRARAWLDTERGNLVAATAYAARHGRTAHSIDVAGILQSYLDGGGHHADALALHTYAREAAGHLGDRAGEARALNGLGLAHYRRGELAIAAQYLNRALTLCRQTGDPPGEAWTLILLGLVSWRRGELGPAAAHLQRALALSRQTADAGAEARALTYLGLVAWRRGELAAAARHLQHALALFTQVADDAGEAMALTFLGGISSRRRKLGPAAQQLQQALRLSRHIGDPGTEAGALIFLGGVCCRRGELDAATARLQQALGLCRRVGDRAGEATASASLAGVLLKQGELSRASEQIQHALALSRQTGERGVEATALLMLGTLHGRRGDQDAAVANLQAGLALTRQVGDRATEADALTALGGAWLQRGQRRAAVDHLQKALALCQQIGYHAGETDALTALGEARSPHSGCRRCISSVR